MHIVIGTVLGASLLMLLLVDVKGKALAGEIFSIQADNASEQTANNEKASWTYEQKLEEARKLLAGETPWVGPTEHKFSESRFIMTNGQFKRSTSNYSEPELRIPLAVLEKVTGRVSVVTITMKGGSIISPPGFPIEIEYRSNGIGWNWWNTQYAAPKGYAVLLNKYPEISHSGRQTTMTGAFLYAPYSSGLHAPELIEAGRSYIQNMVDQAFKELRARGIKSQAFPNVFRADLGELRPEYFERLPLVEQSDMTEFTLNPQWTGERVLVLIGANKGETFNQTRSSAGAAGWMQFTSPTYKSMRNIYPRAQLMVDFNAGAGDHLNSMIAAILLYDNNLKDLVRKFGPSIAQQQELEEYLAAAYNGAPVHMHRTLSAFFTLGLSDWILGNYLKEETKGYMVKIRELKRLELMAGPSVNAAPAL